MTASIESTTLSALRLALDAAALRQQAGAANIAGASAEGHVPLRVAFESQLERARQDFASHGRIQPGALDGVRARIESGEGAVAAPPDARLADLAANSVHYQALLNGLARHLSILAAAAADGRRP